MESEAEIKGKTLKTMSGQVCQICGDNVGLTIYGEPFVACNVFAYPICRPCYEYERKELDQCCPRCKTRYKRHKGSPAIHGDGEEDSVAKDSAAADVHYSEIKATVEEFRVHVELAHELWARGRSWCTKV